MILIRCLAADREALAEIGIDPAQLADDGTDYVCERIEKPWGHEYEKYRDQSASVWWLNIRAQCETSMHCHPNKTTLLMIISGVGTLLTLNANHELSKGELVVIEKGAFHRTRAGKNGLMLWELETPPNKHDLVRLEDSYGRGQGYEGIVSRVP